MNAPIRYSDIELATVRAMWADGSTLREIARSLGRSRNAACNIVHRLNLVGRGNRTNFGKARGWTAHKIAKTKPDAPPAIGPIGDFPAGQTCRHIAGEPDARFQCCGQPGYPFCEFHSAINYTKRGEP